MKPLAMQDAPDLTLLFRNEALVRSIYRGLLGRDPEPAALDYWTQAITDHGNPGSILNAIAESDEFKKNLQLQSQQKTICTTLASLASPLLEQEPLTIVDVGAQELEGEQHVYAAIANHGLPYQTIGFEPLEDKIAESKQRNPDSRVTLFPTFIGDGGNHTFHINNYDATSSLLPLNTILIKDLVDLSHLATVQTEQVATSTLDQVLAEVARVDFLKLDIQGFELEALKHATATLSRTNVVHCEVSFAEIYQGQALFTDVETLLREQGFYFVDFSSTCHYPYHSDSHQTSRDRLGWGDAIFFKRSELLPASRDLLAQAVIAQLVYGKSSFAEFLTAHFDAQSGTALTSAFSGNLR